MVSFFSRLFGGTPADAGGPASRGEPVEYKGLVIRAAPVPAGDQWRLAGVIIKQGAPGAEGDLERSFTRADIFSSREEAASFAERKGRQIIDEQGERLFADGEATGRA